MGNITLTLNESKVRTEKDQMQNDSALSCRVPWISGAFSLSLPSYHHHCDSTIFNHPDLNVDKDIGLTCTHPQYTYKHECVNKHQQTSTSTFTNITYCNLICFSCWLKCNQGLDTPEHMTFPVWNFQYSWWKLKSTKGQKTQNQT